MLDTNDILDTIRMISDENLDVRTVTMGISNIMNAKKIVVVANGSNKAQAVYNMVKGNVTEDCPASILQRHANAVLVCDTLAAAKLQQ